jgi:hypothetical protein
LGNKKINREGIMKKIFGFALGIILFLSGHVLHGQLSNTGQFDNKVHIWGEIKNPGVYELPAGTDIIDLVSQAGGPTEYADINNITIAHRATKPKIEKINLNKYLVKSDSSSLFVLEEGDVVRIPQNWWYKWRTLATITAGITTVANLYYLIILTNNTKK